MLRSSDSVTPSSARTTRRDRVAALLASPLAEARLSAAVGSKTELLVQHTVDDHVAVVRHGGVTLSVVEVSSATGAAHVSAIRTLRSRFPSVPVLAYCAALAGSSRLILEAARAGATALLLRDFDDSPHSLREALRHTRRAAIGERVYRELVPHVDASARPFLRYAVDHAADRVDVRHAAADLGVDPATLGNRLNRARAPSPHKFLTWVRLAVAAELLSDPGRSAQQVALELDFPSGAALRNLFDRYVSATTEQIKQHGPDVVLGELKTVLARERT